ncbi:ankyrin repeat domain-containing protein [Nitratireductor sp. ZSWI3]|uniref:ankyrin repeat domain-containing protein n=1 Tax=Nitratireductor sp. ZSWI3 TaxID=2966359 RepID=UPI00215007B8|nr:ankyrin repeat domain-containing protein [Nitratireductor sp. ZSWI3]MCR4264900.1 ankyrin repeat domain-containing protein [Nitratireductor sp. ZSWI3]
MSIWTTGAFADIFEAAATCEADQLRAEIASGADPKAVDEEGNTVLHWAARNGGDACVELLLEQEPDLDARNDDGETPLMKAAISSASAEGALRSVQLLIDAGADASAPNKFGYSPLFALVVYGGGMTMVLDPALLEPDSKTGIPPHRDAEYDVAKLLLEHGADPNEIDDHGQSLMQFAVERRTPALIDLLVSHGGDLTVKKPPHDRSMLHTAAQNDRVVNIPYLLKQGLAIDGKDANGGTPLMLAAANGKLEATKTLLDAGADTEARDKRGFTPLIFAASEQHLDIVKALVEAGANPNARTSESGNTALQYAAHSGWLEGVKFLLINGADPLITNIQGTTARDFALRQGHTEVADLLASGQPR